MKPEEQAAEQLERAADRMTDSQTDSQMATTGAEEPSKVLADEKVDNETPEDGKQVKTAENSSNVNDLDRGKIDENGEELPRFKLKFQDDDTGFTAAVGTNDLEAFRKTDLMNWLRHCKKQVAIVERTQRAKAQAWKKHEDMLASKKNGENGG